MSSTLRTAGKWGGYVGLAALGLGGPAVYMNHRRSMVPSGTKYFVVSDDDASGASPKYYPPSREEMIQKLKSEQFDILVIGGGAAGACFSLHRRSWECVGGSRTRCWTVCTLGAACVLRKRGGLRCRYSRSQMRPHRSRRLRLWHFEQKHETHPRRRAVFAEGSRGAGLPTVRAAVESPAQAGEETLSVSKERLSFFADWLWCGRPWKNALTCSPLRLFSRIRWGC